MDQLNGVSKRDKLKNEEVHPSIHMLAYDQVGDSQAKGQDPNIRVTDEVTGIDGAYHQFG